MTGAERQKRWLKRHPNYNSSYRQRRRAQNPNWKSEEGKDYRARHGETARKSCRDNYQKHRQERITKIIARHKQRLKADPLYHMINRIRRRVLDALRRARTSKSKRTLDLLGCTAAEFGEHIEGLFQKGMSWENRNLWHIDHIKPICSFDLSTREGQEAAFHYSNCRPLWAADNLRKGAKVII